jgi:hypothetical protein
MTRSTGLSKHERNETIDEFCDSEGISYSHYMGLKRKGIGPKELHIGRALRITPQAKRDWHAMLEKLATSKEARAQQARRREIGRHAGLSGGRPPSKAKKSTRKPAPRSAEIHA